jgi:hypothetical protein
MQSPAQFRAPPPPALGSARYARDYNEVKSLGARFGSMRTAAQTETANFHTDNALALWNRGLRTLADAQVHAIADSARLFALANLSVADSLLAVWDTKYHYVTWRPVTAIREGDTDGNARTAGDASWEPLFNTPNYPDHSSGMNGISGAMTKTMQLFFRTDRMAFSLTSKSPLPLQKTRYFARFSDAAQELVDVRVWQGIHFRFADTAARTQGRSVAKWAFKHFLQPVHRGNGDDQDDDDDGDEDEDDDD